MAQRAACPPAAQALVQPWCAAWLAENQDRFVDELLAFLRIPSVSADPARLDDVWTAARWVEQRLHTAGVCATRLLRAGAHPVVYGEWLSAPGAPTVMIYGHLDVQPAEPQGWTTPPFEPAIREGRIYARGATDDKGNMLAPIIAVEALLALRGRLPLNVKFLFEGQEEILSPDMPAFLREHRELLACDAVISADGWQWSEHEGDLRVGLRGVCALEVTVSGPARDLHSGSHGGAVANPLHGMARLLAQLHADDGSVAVPGFYDAVRSLDEAERAALRGIPFDEDAYKSTLGVTALAGERDYSTRERIGARPTLEINGVHGGHAGPGVRTVIPSQAHAAITCRLVPDQEPRTVCEHVAAFLRSRALPGLRVDVRCLDNAAYPYRVAMTHPALQAARDVLRRIHGREPYYTRSGGSIPVLALFQRELGADTVVFGFGLPDEGMHGPDEHFRLDSFALAQSAFVALFERLAAADDAASTAPTDTTPTDTTPAAPAGVTAGTDATPQPVAPGRTHSRG